MIRFKDYIEQLNEGGNLSIDGFDAQKLIMANADRPAIKKEITLMLKDMNKKFEKEYGYPIWKKLDDLIMQNLMFSGSTRSFFDDKISDEEFGKYKKLVGDMDTMYPENLQDQMKEFLIKYKGKKFGNMKFIGEGGNSLLQQNGLYEMPKKHWDAVRYIQVDFEPSGFDADIPTEFSIFSHYSSWQDIKSNVKGLFIKYLFRNLISSKEVLNDIVVLTSKGVPSKSKKYINPALYGFSVDKGVRTKFKPLLDANGKQVITNGKLTYEETPSNTKKGATFEQSLNTIFGMAFKVQPKKGETKKMFSFVRTMELMKKYLSSSDIDAIYLKFIGLLWGPGAQIIEKGKKGIKVDFEIKNGAIHEFQKAFPSLKKFDAEIDNMAQARYARVK